MKKHIIILTLLSIITITLSSFISFQGIWTPLNPPLYARIFVIMMLSILLSTVMVIPYYSFCMTSRKNDNSYPIGLDKSYCSSCILSKDNLCDYPYKRDMSFEQIKEVGKGLQDGSGKDCDSSKA